MSDGTEETFDELRERLAKEHAEEKLRLLRAESELAEKQLARIREAEKAQGGSFLESIASGGRWDGRRYSGSGRTYRGGIGYVDSGMSKHSAGGKNPGESVEGKFLESLPVEAPSWTEGA